MSRPPALIELLRPDDLLNLRIETENLRFAREPAPDGVGEAVFLEIDDPTRPALLRVLFAPQHIAEFALFESDPRSAPGKPLAPDAGESGQPREANQSALGADKNSAPLGTLDPDPFAPPGALPLKARAAAASRLVFEVPAGRRIPYTVEGLLDWRGLTPLLHPIAALNGADPAARAAAPAISRPSYDQTALELPYRLLISPDATALWAHHIRPFGSHGRYELWHTRMVLPDGDGGVTELDPEHVAPLRALWSPDYRPELDLAKRNRAGTAVIDTGQAGRSALSDDDRHQLVVLTSAFHGYEADAFQPFVKLSSSAGQNVAVNLRADAAYLNLRGPVPYRPEPFHASRLMLSALGGWLTSRGAWTPPREAPPPQLNERISGTTGLFSALMRANNEPLQPRLFADLSEFAFSTPAAPVKQDQLDLSEWVHHTTQGRDHDVRVVYEGALWPFRHKAAMVKVTERKFVQNKNTSGVIAALVQRVFIVVREPTVAVGRVDNPLTQVTLTTRVTPNLAEPNRLAGTANSFWIEVGDATNKQLFRFHASGIDQAGRAVDFTIPLMFASISDTGSIPNQIALINTAYNRASNRAADFLGARLAYTPLAGNNNPLLATRALYFKADSQLRPALFSAGVTIPALAELLGKNDAIRIAYDTDYAAHAFQASNQLEVFARLVDAEADATKMPKDTPLPLGFRADQAGGFATPNQAITALSRKQGTVAGKIADALNDHFEPAAIFPKAGTPEAAALPALPKLFGTFALEQLLAPGLLSAQAPKITSARDGTTLVTRITWEPRVLQTLPVGVATFNKLNYAADALLRIAGDMRTPASGTPTSHFAGTLKDFDIVLLDSVTIHFSEFAFASRNGEKPDIKVKLDEAKPLEFTGDLEFVEDLRRAIPSGLFGEGASVAVTAAGIRAGFSIGLPPLDIGVFALKDISLGAALTLPFLDGKPVLDFNVSERANPFQLRVAFFAGGGFFRLQMDTQGMRQLEAALEFGAAFGLSIAVATGEVHAMAGIYFALTRDDGGDYDCTLGGYLRLGGRLSVIGIIRLSVEFNLSFTYQGKTGKAYGRATVTVMVEVLLISVSVDLTVERAFGGANDPVFLQTFPEPEHWREYANAFA